MRGPVAELRAFLDAALLEPVKAQHPDPPQARTRRRVVVTVTFVVGSVVLGWALHIKPGDPLFYAGSLALAAVWALGALVLLVFLVGSLVVARVPFLREPVDALLDHARFGSLPVVLLITVLNGIAEELYFRGALYAALPSHAVAVTTVLYALTTVGSGVPLLVLAAAVLGLVTALQRRVTGGILGPIITHVTWSTGMLLLLPPALELTR